MKPQLASFKNLFIETARVYIHNILEDITALRKNHDARYAIRDIYISGHSLKSQSMVMGFQNMGSFARAIERLFHEALDNKVTMTSEILTTLENAVSEFGKSIDRVEKENVEDSLTSARESLEKIVKEKVRDK